MGFDIQLGNIRPLVQVQITPFLWGLGFCLNIRQQKAGIRFGPLALAVTGFGFKWIGKIEPWRG